ncbi:MAG: transcriptional repressor [Actinomycetota bacterium]|nr:transcriptional repressor [Actinomycetota bacterium]
MDVEATLEPALHEGGHRLTRPRRLVWDVLRLADRHLTAEQVAARVHEVDPDVNLASVYRSLALFAELELARESRLGVDNASRWEPAHPDDRFHLVCRSCGEVQHHAGDLVEQLRVQLRTRQSFDADAIDLVVSGHCDRCAAEQP